MYKVANTLQESQYTGILMTYLYKQPAINASSGYQVIWNDGHVAVAALLATYNEEMTSPEKASVLTIEDVTNVEKRLVKQLRASFLVWDHEDGPQMLDIADADYFSKESVIFAVATAWMKKNANKYKRMNKKAAKDLVRLMLGNLVEVEDQDEVIIE